MAISKYSGAGNDFIIVDARAEPGFTDGAVAARGLCRRAIAVGADGLVIVETEDLEPGVHGRMRLWNADGTEAEFSGNAARCVVRYLADQGIAAGQVRVQTDIGIVEGHVDGRTVRVAVPGNARVWPQRKIRVEGRDLVGTYVIVGVPFFVLLHEAPDDLPVRYLGRALRHHPELAPAGANVDFVRVDEEQSLYFRVYERGVEAETLSSGTGSVAAALAAAAAGRVASPVACNAAGGTLTVRFRVVPPPRQGAEVNAQAGDRAAAPDDDPNADGNETAAAPAVPDVGFELPPIAQGQPLVFIAIEVEGDTRKVFDGTARSDALRKN